MLINLYNEEKLAFDEKKKIVSDFITLTKKSNNQFCSHRDIMELFSVKEIFSNNFIESFVEGFIKIDENDTTPPYLKFKIPTKDFIYNASSILSKKSKVSKDAVSIFSLEERQGIVNFFLNEYIIPQVYTYERVALLEYIFNIFSKMLFENSSLDADSLLHTVLDSKNFEKYIDLLTRPNINRSDYDICNFLVSVLKKAQFTNMGATIVYLKGIFESRNIPFNQFPIVILNPTLSREDRKIALKNLFRQKDFPSYKRLLVDGCRDAEIISDFIEVTIINNNRVREKKNAVASLFKDLFVNGVFETFYKGTTRYFSLIAVLDNLKTLLETVKEYLLDAETMRYFFSISVANITTKTYERRRQLNTFVETVYFSSVFTDEEITNIAYEEPEIFKENKEHISDIKSKYMRYISGSQLPGMENEPVNISKEDAQKILSTIKKIQIRFAGDSLHDLFLKECDCNVDVFLEYLLDPELKEIMEQLGRHEQLFRIDRKETYCYYRGGDYLKWIRSFGENWAYWIEALERVASVMPASVFCNMPLFNTRKICPPLNPYPAYSRVKSYLFGIDMYSLRNFIENSNSHMASFNRAGEDFDHLCVDPMTNLLKGILSRLEKDTWTDDERIIAESLRDRYLCDFEDDSLLENTQSLGIAYSNSEFAKTSSSSKVLNLLSLWKEVAEQCYREDTQSLSDEEITAGKKLVESIESAASLLALVI